MGAAGAPGGPSWLYDALQLQRAGVFGPDADAPSAADCEGLLDGDGALMPRAVR